MLSLFALLVACKPPVDAETVVVEGVDGLPVVTWSGADSEILTFQLGADVLWNIQPTAPGPSCLNPLIGADGVTFGELPPGYEAISFSGAPMDPPAPLEDGDDYSVGVGTCINVQDTVRSYYNSGAGFSVIDGEIVQHED